MESPQIFAGAGLLGILAGSFLAGITPATLKPMEPPEWRQLAAAQREQTAALYAYSMPEDLSPRIGFGNPALHERYVELASAEVSFAPAPLAERPAALPPAPEPIPQTGNEETIANLKAVSDGFDSPPADQPEPVQQQADGAEL